MHQISILMIFLISSAFGQWTYEDQENWPGLCHTGDYQSPIAIVSGKTKRLNNVPFKYSNYDHSYPVNLMNNGHTAEITVSSHREPPSITGGGLKDIYMLENVHFHWYAEHVIDNNRYPLEAHLVHFAKKYGNLSRALDFSDGVVVLAVFYKFSNRRNEAFNEVIENLPRVAKNISTPVNIDKLTFGRFLPNYRYQDSFYRYKGSTTTPGCNEVVTWTLFHKVLQISIEQHEAFSNIYERPNNRLKRNFRNLQDLNGRIVYEANYLYRSPSKH